MNTNSLLQALYRFTNKRGLPSSICPDKARNLSQLTQKLLHRNHGPKQGMLKDKPRRREFSGT